MTREEAIARLKGLYGNGYPEQEEALDMAISALSAEPCEDCISRQHLLSEIENLKKSPWYNDKRNGWEYLIAEAVETVCDLCIKQEPSVQPKKGKPTLEEVTQYARTHDLVLWTREESEEVIRKLLSAEPKKGEWIPVSERLPEVDKDGYSDYILLSFENYGMPSVGMYWQDKDGNGAFHDGDVERTLVSVKAWMPLPEPYKKGGE